MFKMFNRSALWREGGWKEREQNGTRVWERRRRGPVSNRESWESKSDGGGDRKSSWDQQQRRESRGEKLFSAVQYNLAKFKQFSYETEPCMFRSPHCSIITFRFFSFRQDASKLLFWTPRHPLCRLTPLQLKRPSSAHLHWKPPLMLVTSEWHCPWSVDSRF